MIILQIRNTLVMILMFLVFAVAVSAQTKNPEPRKTERAASGSTLTWTPPTSRVDGTPLDPATELSKYKLWCGGKETTIPATSEPNKSYAFTREEILPGYGDWECRMEAFDTNDPPLFSEPSNPVTISWRPPGPSAPTNLIYITDPAPAPTTQEPAQ